MPAFKEDYLWGVNACWLYLKVTMLSEITDNTGQNIETWAMYVIQSSPSFSILVLHAYKNLRR